MHPTHILRLAIAACTCCATVHCTASSSNHVHDHSLLRKSPTSSFNILDRALSFRALEGEEHEGEEHEGEEHEGEHHDDDEKKPKPWGRVFGGTLLVNLATILGVVFLTPVCRKKQDPDSAGPTKTRSILDIIVPSFAAGALIATALFLTVPEAIALIQGQLMEDGEEGHGDEHGDEHGDHEDHRFMEEDEHEGHDDHGFELMPSAIWRFAASFLGGFMLPLVFAAIFPKGHGEDEAKKVVVAEKDFEDDDDGERNSTDDAKTPINKSLVLSILFGDGLCNFSDGVFIGIAFYQCDLSIAMAVVGITLYHEVPQELADYFLLTRYAGLTPFQALGINFLTGLTVVFGGLLVLMVDLSNLSVGVLLAIASGVYTYIAACECLPRVNKAVSTSNEKLFMMFMFICGCIPVGLTLIGHTHCDAH